MPEVMVRGVRILVGDVEFDGYAQSRDTGLSVTTINQNCRDNMTGQIPATSVAK